MKKTYVTTVPNHIGAFLSASRLLAALGVPEASRAALLATQRAKNHHELRAAASAPGQDEAGAAVGETLIKVCMAAREASVTV